MRKMVVTCKEAASVLLCCRASVTGGAALIGSHIVDVFLASGASEILILDNFVRGRRENLKSTLDRGPVSIITGDIRDRALLDRAMDGMDVVFHQAAIRITQCADEPRLALEVLVEGTFNVIQAAVNAGVKKV